VIHVNTDTRVIFIHGIARYESIVEAVETALGKKWRFRGTWVMVGIADDESRGMTTGLPFSPPQEERNKVGFKRPTP
jgi:hypothetical protein